MTSLCPGNRRSHLVRARKVALIASGAFVTPLPRPVMLGQVGKFWSVGHRQINLNLVGRLTRDPEVKYARASTGCQPRTAVFDPKRIGPKPGGGATAGDRDAGAGKAPVPE